MKILSNQRFLSWVALWLVVQPSHHIPPSRGDGSEKHKSENCVLAWFEFVLDLRYQYNPFDVDVLCFVAVAFVEHLSSIRFRSL